MPMRHAESLHGLGCVVRDDFFHTDIAAGANTPFCATGAFNIIGLK